MIVAEVAVQVASLERLTRQEARQIGVLIRPQQVPIFDSQAAIPRDVAAERAAGHVELDNHGAVVGGVGLNGDVRVAVVRIVAERLSERGCDAVAGVIDEINAVEDFIWIDIGSRSRRESR